MKQPALRLLGLLALTVLAGCGSPNHRPYPMVSAEQESPVVQASYNAVDALLAGQTLSPVIIPRGHKGILVATVADINNLNRSSAFGRMLSEQLSSRLAQLGIPVNELKLRDNLFVNQAEGEFLLSRELKEISAAQNADYVLVGTYANGGGAAHVTIKLVRATDSRVSNAYNFSVRITESIKGLFANNPGP